MSQIANWYTGKNILITGGTGFIGKVLIVKLLTSCSNISKIYILLREKRGTSPENRKAEIINTPLFENIRENHPELLQKIIIVKYCLEVEGLDLDDKYKNDIINDCDVIFHIAADVGFLVSLHEISKSNIFGVRHIMEFAKKIKNLKCFIYCSTSFSQHHKVVLEESYYKPHLEPELLKSFLNKFDEHTMNILTSKILQNHANTYSLSKSLGEHIVYTSDCSFPIAIARPSIVCGAHYEPMPGWTEGLHGINGFIIATGMGVLKTVMGDKNNPAPLVPVDVVANTLINLGWQLSIRQPREIEFYNIAQTCITWQHILTRGEVQLSKTPFDYALLRVGGTFKTNRLHNQLCALWVHVLPAILIDFLLILFMRKPIMIRLRKKIDQGTSVIQHYTFYKFLFETDKFERLNECLNDVDKRLYRTNITKALSSDEYIFNMMKGIKTYVFGEKMENVPKARLFHKMLNILTGIFYLCIAYLVGSFLCKRREMIINFFIPH